MLRFFVFGTNLPTWTVAEYHHTLLYDHAPLVRGCDEFVKHCSGYVQNHVQAGGLSVRGPSTAGDLIGFQNCSEFWFRDEAELARAYQNESYLLTLRPDEKRFGNPARRVALGGITSKVVRNREIRSGGVKLMLLHDDAASTPTPLSEALMAIARMAPREEWTTLTSVMDFARLQFVTDRPAPFRYITGFWFDSVQDVAEATKVIGSLSMNGDLLAATVKEHWVLTPNDYRS